MVRVGGERHPGQAVVFRGREQAQRIPAAAPDITDTLTLLQDEETGAGLSQVETDRQAGLATADHDYVELMSRRGWWCHVFARAGVRYHAGHETPPFLRHPVS